MRIIKQSATLEFITSNALAYIEKIGRVCYKSEELITEASNKAFIKKLLDPTRKHESVLEHGVATFRFITDRGVTHEMVRHRIASYSQESTRYVGYSDKLLPDADMSEENVIEKYIIGVSMKKISELSRGKYTEWDIYKILDNEDIERRNVGNKGIIYEDFFDCIDTPEKAYLLGFIQADGSLSGRSYQISITQKNGWFIERMLKDFIKPTTYGSQDHACKQYSFTNERLYNSLLSKGVIPNKSNVMEKQHAHLLWNSVADDYKWDFLRGFLDGDGCIRFFKQSNKGQTDSCNITWVGNKDLLELIVSFLTMQVKYTPNVLKVSGSTSLYRISITQPEVGDFVCSLMYRNFIFPYGHPVKTSRVFTRKAFKFKIAEWGHPKFKVILPVRYYDVLSPGFWNWAEGMEKAEEGYTKALSLGESPQEARDLLPNSLKTEIVMTANFREWRLFFHLRTAPTAHPQMRELATQALVIMRKEVPILFDEENL